MGKIAVLLFVSMSTWLVSTAPAGAAPQPFSDTLCPRAVPRVIAFNEAAGNNDLPKVRAAAHAAAEAYHACATELQATANIAIEPGVNYNKTRFAQFAIVAGRLDAAQGDLKGGLATLRDARSAAQDVVDWQPQSQTYSMSNGGAGNSSGRNSDRNGSRFKDSALEILAAANAELAKLAAAPAASPKP